MKILLTGNEGYIGTILADTLIRAGYEVVGLDTGFYNSNFLYDGIKTPAVTIHKDVRQLTPSDLHGITTVVHLAELSNDPLGQTDPRLTKDINHAGTMRLIDLAKQAGVTRFIYFSSCSVYGASDEFVDETSSVNPLTEYAKCKVLNEQYLLKQASETFSPLIFRNATVYGASPRLRFDLVVNNLAGLAWTTKKIKMDSDGTPWRPLVHVRDVAKATIVALATQPTVTHKQIVNVGQNLGNYQIKEVASIISKVFPGCKVSFNPKGEDKRNYKVRFDKVKSILPGFSCDWDVAGGAGELKRLFSETNLTKEDFLSPKHTRLLRINELRRNGKIDEKLYWNKI